MRIKSDKPNKGAVPRELPPEHISIEEDWIELDTLDSSDYNYEEPVDKD